MEDNQNSEICKNMGNRIREKREQKGWSRVVLARKAGDTTEQIIRRIENGGGTRFSTLVNIASALETSTDELLVGTKTSLLTEYDQLASAILKLTKEGKAALVQIAQEISKLEKKLIRR